jgi:hypothetical protein
MACIKVPWEDAFSTKNCLRAWEVIGLSPFTRHVYWKLKSSESRLERQATEKGLFKDAELSKLLPHRANAAFVGTSSSSADANLNSALVVRAGPGVPGSINHTSCQGKIALTAPATDNVMFAMLLEKEAAALAKKAKTDEGKAKTEARKQYVASRAAVKIRCLGLCA